MTLTTDDSFAFRYSAAGQWPMYPRPVYAMPLNEWVHARVSWWISINWYCVMSCAVKLEIEEDGGWVNKGVSYAPDNTWADTGIARTGFAFNRGPNFLDDLIIRGPA